MNACDFCGHHTGHDASCLASRVQQAAPPYVLGSDTSRRAAASMRGRSGAAARAAVLTHLRLADDGLTADQIEADSGMSGNTIRPRLVELQAAGLVRKTGETRPTRSGRRADVWFAVRGDAA